jgi:hypothetical protein
MVMISDTLAGELENMVPTEVENEAIDRFAAAWETYFYDAVVGAIPANPGTLSAATSAMKSTMVGMSTQDAGATAIQTGITAFWGIVAASAPSIWTTVPPCTGATPPPVLSTIAAALTGVFSANTAGELGLSDACAAIAAAIHPLNLGGICVIPTPGAPTPIT